MLTFSLLAIYWPLFALISFFFLSTTSYNSTSFLTVKEVDAKYNLLMLGTMDKCDHLRRQS